jgi:hypothetical protein
VCVCVCVCVCFCVPSTQTNDQLTKHIETLGLSKDACNDPAQIAQFNFHSPNTIQDRNIPAIPASSRLASLSGLLLGLYTESRTGIATHTNSHAAVHTQARHRGSQFPRHAAVRFVAPPVRGLTLSRAVLDGPADPTRPERPVALAAHPTAVPLLGRGREGLPLFVHWFLRAHCRVPSGPVLALALHRAVFHLTAPGARLQPHLRQAEDMREATHRIIAWH